MRTDVLNCTHLLIKARALRERGLNRDAAKAEHQAARIWNTLTYSNQPYLSVRGTR